MTLKLWADPVADGSRSCCSPEAVLHARSLAHRMGLPHLTLDLQEDFRRAGRERLRRRARRRAHPQPLRSLQRHGALRRDAGAGIAHRRVDARHRPLRARRPRRRRAAAGARERRPQGPDLHALGAAAAAARSRPLSARRPHQAAGAEHRGGGGPAGGREEREPGPLLPGRDHARAVPRATRARRRSARARSWTGAAACSAGIPASAASRSASAAASALAAAEPQYVLDKDAASNRVVVGPREQLAVQARDREPGDALPRRQPRRPGQAPLPLAAGAVLAGAAGRRRAPTRRWSWICTSRSTAPRRARRPACWRATRVLGYGTIAASHGRAAA